MPSDVSTMTDEEILRTAMEQKAEKQRRATYQKGWREDNKQLLADKRKAKKERQKEIAERAQQILEKARKKAARKPPAKPPAKKKAAKKKATGKRRRGVDILAVRQ